MPGPADDENSPAAGKAKRLADAFHGTLDDWLPSYSVREHHERLVAASPEETLAATLRLPVAPDWIVRALLLLRGLGAGRQSIADFASTGGFVILEQTPTTFVFGLAGGYRPRWRLARTRQEWVGWSSSGVKIVGDFRAHAAPDGGTRLTTETRVQTLSPASRLVFRLYWLVVGPFSALIRRRWLRAIARTAPSPPAGETADPPPPATDR